MEIYKQALSQKLRVQTNKGNLSVEQLFDLSVKELDELAVSLQENYESSGKKSFIVKRNVKDKTLKLQFDIVLDILQTKIEEAEEAKIAKENKEHNQRIMEVIAGKADEELKGKSIKQLEAMLR